MADFAEFIPVRRETIATIRARYNADAVAGDPPERAVDLTPGGHAWDLSQALLLEDERLWDFGATEVPAVMFITYAWGEYLDLHGEVLDTPRKPAVAATGIATFTGDPGTLIGTGVRVSTMQTDPDADPVSVRTTASGTIPAGGSIDLSVVAEEEGTEGNVAPNTLTELGTPVEGVNAVTNANPLSSGEEVESDESYRVRLLLKFVTAEGASSPTDLQKMALAYPGIGFATVEPNWIGPGYGRIVVMDPANNPVGPGVVDGFQQQIDPPTASTTLSANTTFPPAGGTVAVVSTTGFAATGPNMRFYAAGHAFAYTAKTATSFTGVTILDPGGFTGTLNAGTEVIQSGQGGGGGDVAMGAEIIVATGTLANIDVAATIVFRSGYSLDGGNGTVATRDAIMAALAAYIENLPPGEDVILNHVESAFFTVEGVYDVSGVTLNGGAANVPLTTLQVAQLGTVTLA
jgi:uncharacterized phage protein gp47/JayE